MDDPGPALLPALRSGGCERLGERAAGVAGRRMHDDAGGLVHDEEMLVGVGDRELRQRDRRLLGGRGRCRDYELLPTRELVALPARLSVDEHGAGHEEPFRRGAGAHFRQPGEIAVEPLSRGLGGNDEPVQRLGVRGSRSERSSAARRIPTPITMKLSARLKAGQ